MLSGLLAGQCGQLVFRRQPGGLMGLASRRGKPAWRRSSSSRRLDSRRASRLNPEVKWALPRRPCAGGTVGPGFFIPAGLTKGDHPCTIQVDGR